MSFIEKYKTMLAIAAGMIAVVTTAVTTTWWLATELSQIRVELSSYENDRYTLTMASENALREAMANPGLSVPDPRHPGEYFQVTIGD